MNRVIGVGITGGIGSGKSIVSQIFRLLGIAVYDADARAKWLMNHDVDLRKNIINLFGPKAYNKEGLDRNLLSSQAFKNKEKLRRLNQLVHPKVGEDYLCWQYEQKGPYTLKEAALLFETGSYKSLDKIIVVTAPLEIRIQRVLQRDPYRSKNQVEAIINNQWPDDKKLQQTNFSVVNNDRELVLPQVLGIHKELFNYSVSRLTGNRT